MSEPIRIQLVTKPTELPVDIEAAKSHVRLDSDEDQNLLQGMIATATKLAENYLRRAIMTQTWKQYFDAWPACGVELAKAPLQSVTHIKTYDDSDVATTFAASNYQVDAISQPGRIALRSSGSVPTPTRTLNGIEIQFVCGYNSDPNEIPADIKSGVLDLVAWLYEHRGDENQTPPDSVYSRLDGERTWLV